MGEREKPTRLQQLEGEYNRKPSNRERIWNAIIPAASMAVAGIAGGEAGLTGAGQAIMQNTQNEQAMGQARRRNLLEEMEAERNRQERLQERNLTVEAQKAGIEAENQRSASELKNRMDIAKLGQAGKVQDLIGPDGKLHKYQFNEQTGRYDIDLGMSKQPTARALQLKAGTINGQPAMAAFDPETGQILDAQGNDISKTFIPHELIQKPDNSITPYEDFRKQGGTVQQYLSLTNARAGANDDSLVDSILSDPLIYDGLTAKTKERISPELQKRGFTGFGKQLTDTAIKQKTQTETAISSLQDLRKVIEQNSAYMGPVAGLSSYLPWSDARKAQATIDMVKQRVGKALEGGVLRKEDEEKYKKILPTMQDPPELAASKIDGLIQALQNDLQTFMSGQQQAGRKIEGAAPITSPANAGGANLNKNRFTVTLSNGTTKTFDSKFKADQFKADAEKLLKGGRNAK
jgi:hypothetical protein